MNHTLYSNCSFSYHLFFNIQYFHVFLYTKYFFLICKYTFNPNYLCNVHNFLKIISQAMASSINASSKQVTLVLFSFFTKILYTQICNNITSHIQYILPIEYLKVKKLPIYILFCSTRKVRLCYLLFY